MLFLVACKKENCQERPSIVSTIAPKGVAAPLFKFSITSNTIDFIKSTDPDAFETLTYLGQEKKEMPDSRTEELFDKESYVFNANFANGKKIDVWCHSSFGSKSAAEEYANKLCLRIGKLPAVQRDELNHVIIHTGNAPAFAETAGRFFVLYADNMDQRISENHLEETVFHESVHASLQDIHEQTLEWKTAQLTDGNYVTEYAKSLPSLEDMPESALFCYVVLKHPERLSSDIENWIKDYMPNRLEFFKDIYE